MSLEQVRLFWSSGPLMCGLSLSVGLALLVAQWPVIESTRLLTWTALLLFATLAWGGLAWRFRQQRPAIRATASQVWLALGVAFGQGVVWGLAAWFLFPPDNLAHQAILTVLLAGISAGAVSSLSAIALAGTLFLVPALLPLGYRLALAGGHESLLILAIVLVLLLTLILSNRHLYTTLRDNLRLRIEKAISEATLHESEARYRLMFEQSPLGILHYDARGVVVACNTPFVEILGTSREEVLGTRMSEDLDDQRMAAAVRMSLEAGWGYYEATYQAPTGAAVPLRAFFNAVTGADGELLGGVAIFEDFTQRKEVEDALNRQAFYDPLTALPNRRLLHDRLNQALKVAQRHGRYGALIFLDVDYFKRVNDWLGHHEGDEILKVLADRLRHTMRDEDTVARLSGDEFILLAPDLGPDEQMARRAIRSVTERIQQVLQEPTHIAGRELRLSASMGVTIFPRDDQTPDQLLRQSDTAMYVAKQEVRGEIRFHHRDMDTDEEERLGLENDLGLAIERRELGLHYQPIVDGDGRTVGGEALLRWRHPRFGDVSPERFIPAAEASGLIIALGRWVVDRNCQWFSGLDERERDRLQRLSLNISAREFHHPEFARNVETALDRHGLDGSWLTLEVTESVLIDRVAATVKRMERLKQLGVRFEVDDFGTGYSSLTYLKRLPVDGIKIDRSFIRDVQADHGNAAIVDAILAMASRLNLDVVAEGVEAADQFEFLKSHGCRLFQGFYWSRPMTGEDFLAHLARPDRDAGRNQHRQERG